MPINLARTLRSHAWGLLGWQDRSISTGPLEGADNRTETVRRQAYGFRDQDFFQLTILAIHQTK